MNCPHCGKNVPCSRKELITQLAKVTGIMPAVLTNLSILAAKELLLAWERKKK